MPAGGPRPSGSGRPIARSTAAALGAAAVLVIAFLTTQDDDPAPAPGSDAAGTGTVTHIVDGDTLDVRVNGTEERVRLIGVDTPESVAPERPVQCFGAEASAELARLVPVGTEVRLERDEVARDRFDRLLAYVFRTDDDLLVNLALVEGGFADAVTFGDNEAIYDTLLAAEADARADGRGLWGACGGPDVDIGPPPTR